jgi:hypothetical protein
MAGALGEKNPLCFGLLNLQVALMGILVQFNYL